MTEFRYMDVISEAPLMIVRVPLRHGSDRLIVPWRQILKAITTVMRSHGLRLKDVYAIESMGPAAPTPKFETQWEVERIQLEKAFGCDPIILPDFWLYDWKDDAFTLTREPSSPRTT